MSKALKKNVMDLQGHISKFKIF